MRHQRLDLTRIDGVLNWQSTEKTPQLPMAITIVIGKTTPGI